MIKPERLARKTIYESPWVNLHLDRVKFPAGRVIDEYHVVDMQVEAVGVIVQDDEDRLLMVQAYRYPTDSIDWEIPAGGIDAGETPEIAASREVHEETGVQVGDVEYLYKFHPLNGSCNKIFHLARGTARTAGTNEFDRNEVAGHAWIELGAVRHMLRNNEIRDGYTLAALLWVLGAV